MTPTLAEAERPWTWTTPKDWLRHGGTVAVNVAAVAVVRFALDPVLQERAVFLPFAAAVAVSAHLGGFWAGLASSLLSTLVAAVLFLDRRGPVGIAPEAWLQVAMFAVTALALCVLGGYLRSYRIQLLEALARERRLLRSESGARAEAERASRAKDEFLAFLSHELRSPLNAVVGWAHILKGMRLPPDATKAVETILRNVDHQVRLMSEIADVSRVATGKLVLESALVDVRSVLDQAVNVVRLAADTHGLFLQLVIPDTPLVVRGDAARLQQVFLNLLSNAIKFSAPGASVQASAAREGETVLVTVTDTGQGIRTEFLPYVFDSFRQEDPSKSRRHGGLGLGLSIVRHLTEAHGGTVQVHSQGEGKGATFTVALPLCVGSSAELMPTELTRPELAGLRILVVEDDPDARDLIGRALGELGADVITASSAAQARLEISKQAPDAIVSDIGMPVEDGLTFMRAMRQQAEHGHIPAIAVTAYASAADRADALEAGYHEHVAKPVQPYQLARAILASLHRPR